MLLMEQMRDHRIYVPDAFLVERFVDIQIWEADRAKHLIYGVSWGL
jgi:hypothetical protein